MTPQPPRLTADEKPNVLLVILKHLGCYLLGILACVMFTPVDPVLAGKALWPLYPILAVLGAFFYFALSPTYTFGSDVVHWLVGLIGLTAVVFGVVAYLVPLQMMDHLQQP